jgi:transposase
VLAATATGEPKDADGEVEMIPTLRIARRSALKARAQALSQIKTMLISAPERLSSELCGLSTARLLEKASKASRLRPGANPSDVVERPPSSSRCARWRVATKGSPRRSASWRSNWNAWLPRPRRSSW